MRSRVIPFTQFTLLCCPLSFPCVRSRVTPVRVALLRVLLGRLYTLSVLLPRLVRPVCGELPRPVRPVCAMLLRSVRGVVARTPRSALAGPVARGT